jgi:hypothetical protein
MVDLWAPCREMVSWESPPDFEGGRLQKIRVSQKHSCDLAQGTLANSSALNYLPE